MLCAKLFSTADGSRRAEAGGLLLITVITLFLVGSMTVGLLSVAGNAIYLNNIQQNRALAFNIAESGAELTALWLRDQPYPPSDISPFDPFGGEQNFGEGSFEVTVIPDPDNYTSYLKTYQIRSVGRVRNAEVTVEIALRQASFGRFAYFTDKETSSISGGAIWWKAGETVDGPVHSNNSGGSNFNINYVGSTSPIFLDMVTGSGPRIDYYPGSPNNENTFKKIYKDGSKGFRLGVPRIEMPPSTSIQKEAAWGGTDFPGGSSGVYLRADAGGGIYIQGNASITLSVNGSGNQVVTIKQGTRTTVITIDRHTRTASVSGPVGSGSPTSSTTLPNGVIFCSGHITSLSGTVADNLVQNGEIVVRSSMTIATEVSKTNPSQNKDIEITGNLVYRTRPNKHLDDDASANLAAGTLGLVARDIRISSSSPRNVEINAVCMCGGQDTNGSFYAENYDSRQTGTLTVLGGIIQRSRGPVGTFNSSTGQTSTGFTKNYSYDPRLAANPPPFYPTTGQYERLSWQVLPAD